MNQRKYFGSVILILLVLILGYFAVKNFSKTKGTKKSIEIIDIENTVDSLPKNISEGKKLFYACATCHSINKDGTGPAMAGVTERWPNKKELFAFIRNPPLVMSRNAYARKLKDKYKSMMAGFPTLTDNEIQAILDYIKTGEKNRKKRIQ